MNGGIRMKVGTGRGGLPILTYHALDDSGAATATPPRWFAATMARLHAEGYRALDLADWVARGRPARARAFALAFDDGLRSIRPAAEILARYGFAATAFLVTGRMGRAAGWSGSGSAPVLRWSDLADLQAAGFRLASHSRTHPRLDRLGSAALDDELRGARDDIEDRTGCACPLFAYPFGNAPARVRRAAARHYESAFGTALGEADAGEDLYHLSRVDAFYLRSPRVLDAMIAGRWRPWLHVRRAMRGVRRLVA